MSKRRRKQKARTRVAPKRDKPLPENPVGFMLDPERRQLLVFSPDMLVNQLRRDGPKIEKSFDALCDRDLRELSKLQSTTSALLFSGAVTASRQDKELDVACSELLFNASSSFCSALALLRMGFVLQPGIIVRSLLESISTVLHLLQRPSDLAAYKDHSLQSPKTVTTAKKALPPFGNLYGYFSDNFAHIGQLHKSVTPIREFHVRNEPLELNLQFLRMSAWLLYVTAELLFNELLDEPRYWKPIEGGYAWNPSDEERYWMASFLGVLDEEGS
jgi:hypothetical protein